MNSPSPFVYLSAEDIFRPFISPRYIETKREAEQAILDRLASSSEDASSPQRSIRPVFVRPSAPLSLAQFGAHLTCSHRSHLPPPRQPNVDPPRNSTGRLVKDPVPPPSSPPRLPHLPLLRLPPPSPSCIHLPRISPDRAANTRRHDRPGDLLEHLGR